MNTRLSERQSRYILWIMLLLGVIAGCGQSKLRPTTLGAVLPLTGDAAVWGQPTKDGIDLALALLNRAGGVNGHPLRVIYEDSRADPTTGLAAIKKLIDVNGVPAVLDNSTSSVTLAMAPYANARHVVLLATGASAPKISESGPFVFRIWNSDALEGALVAHYAKHNLNLSRAAILYVNNNYGVGLSDAFIKAFTRDGGSSVTGQSFAADASDFRAQITRVISADEDFIYLICYPNQGGQLLKQLAELGNRKKLIGAVAFEDKDMLARAVRSARCSFS